MFWEEGPQGSIIDRVINTLEERYGTETNDQGTADQTVKSPTQGRRGRTEQKGSQKENQVSELQGDLFNADPKNEKQLELFPALAGSGKKYKASGNKSGVKADPGGKSSDTQGGVRLTQSQRIGVKTTGYVQHLGLVVESDADVAAFLATL